MAGTLISGPAGAGKSQRARELLAAAQAQSIVVDFQSIYSALLLLQRTPDGRYPERLESDAFVLRMAEHLRIEAINAAQASDIEVIATNSDGNPTRRNFLLGLMGVDAIEEVVDPGRSVVVSRLSRGGSLSEQCEQAIGRWYLELRSSDSLFVVSDDTLELREGRTLSGVVVAEGQPATGGRAEVFTPGSIEWPDEGIDIKPAHRTPVEVRAIPVRDSQSRITIEAPLTDKLRTAWERGHRYLSIEFHSIEERTTAGGVRAINRALAVGAALVPNPEYDLSKAEVREQEQDREIYRWL